jgi:hypothetical protein
MTTARNRLDEPVTLDRLERGLALLAHLVTLDGEVLLPLFEKLERDLEILRGKQDAANRAMKLAATYKVAGGVKEMA